MEYLKSLVVGTPANSTEHNARQQNVAETVCFLFCFISSGGIKVLFLNVGSHY